MTVIKNKLKIFTLFFFSFILFGSQMFYAFDTINEYDTAFGGDAYLSEIFLYKIGSFIISITHPLSHHRHTTMKKKILLSKGNVKIVFDTECRSWKKGNHIKWSVVFNKNKLPIDFHFIKDTGKYKTGMFYSRIKVNVINGIRKIIRKQ